MTDHFIKELGMELVTGDGALFFKSMDEKLKEICVTYVDDSLQAGDKYFQDLTKKTSERFECLALKVYSNSSYASNPDGTSQ